MSKLNCMIVGVCLVIACWSVHLISTGVAAVTPIPIPFPTIQNVACDYLAGNPVAPRPGQTATDEVEISWAQDRYFIGWNPWFGTDKGVLMEGHVLLIHRAWDPNSARWVDFRLFQIGPHKEIANTMYDECRPVFFPAGVGRRIAKGDKLIMQTFVRSTGDNSQGGLDVQGQAQLFTLLP